MSALSAGGSPVALAEGEIFEDDDDGVEGELKKMKPPQKRVGVAGMDGILCHVSGDEGKKMHCTVKST